MVEERISLSDMLEIKNSRRPYPEGSLDTNYYEDQARKKKPDFLQSSSQAHLRSCLLQAREFIYKIESMDRRFNM
jgi:hypothetical protein